MKLNKPALLLGLAVLLSSATASAVPDTMTFSGRLSTSSGPVDGSVNVIFRIFSAATGGSPVWTETRNGVGADNGLVFVELGQITPLDEVVFDDAQVFLEIQVGTETLTPRIAINSVPYAIRAGSAGSADTLGGTIGPDDVISTVTGGAGVQVATGANSATVGLSTSGCSGGEVWKYDGSAWSCEADANTTYTGAGAIAVAGTTISLSTSGCVAGEVWKYNGSAWSCETDAGTTYTGTSPINVAGSTISLATTGCVSGDVWKYNGSAWSCDPDASAAYTGASGISVSGTTIGLSTSGCAAGEVWKYNGSAWSCEPDSTYTDAQAVAAVTAQTVTHSMSYGPANFAMAKLDGTALSCGIVNNCAIPTGTTTLLRIPLGIPAPSTLTDVTCRINDNDATTNITMTIYNSSSTIDTASTTGAPGILNLSISGLTESITSGSRGPTLTVSFASTSGQPQMYIYECWATYTTTGL